MKKKKAMKKEKAVQQELKLEEGKNMDSSKRVSPFAAWDDLMFMRRRAQDSNEPSTTEK